MEAIDARGLDCPKPVIMAKALADKGRAEFSVRLDNGIAAANVTRFLENAGYSVKRTESAGEITLIAKGGAAASRPHDGGEGTGILLLSDKIGAESGGLGEALMKAFLSSLAQRTPLPAVIALMNEGVLMALPGSSASDTLKELEDMGVKVLVCGACAKHFGITDRIAAGTVSNMFEITEDIFSLPKPVVIG